MQDATTTVCTVSMLMLITTVSVTDTMSAAALWTKMATESAITVTRQTPVLKMEQEVSADKAARENEAARIDKGFPYAKSTGSKQSD